MKHTIKITLFLVLLFLAAQITGLIIINKYFDKEKTQETGIPSYRELPYNMERPQLPPIKSLIFISLMIVVGTGILFIIIKFRKENLWRAWFFLSILLCLSIALAAFMPGLIALIISTMLAVFKVFKPNFIIHNFTELLVYGGLAAIFVPILNLLAATVLLILISGYDMFAVWKSKHMIKLAKFQTESKLFAGMLIPYELKKAKKTVKTKKTKKIRTAIIGGGDIGFPLIFAGVVMQQFGFYKTLIIPMACATALLLLLIKGEQNKFYPAMPFLTTGCFIGYGIILLISLL